MYIMYTSKQTEHCFMCSSCTCTLMHLTCFHNRAQSHRKCNVQYTCTGHVQDCLQVPASTPSKIQPILPVSSSLPLLPACQGDDSSHSHTDQSVTTLASPCHLARRVGGRGGGEGKVGRREGRVGEGLPVRTRYVFT